jgi:hypothetical protein
MLGILFLEALFWLLPSLLLKKKKKKYILDGKNTHPSKRTSISYKGEHSKGEKKLHKLNSLLIKLKL